MKYEIILLKKEIKLIEKKCKYLKIYKMKKKFACNSVLDPNIWVGNAAATKSFVFFFFFLFSLFINLYYIEELDPSFDES